MSDIRLEQGDCLEVLRRLEADSVDAIVTDPPYGISFMGRKWDYDVPSVEIWKECLRVLKPGGHLLSFAGTKTHHRMCVNIEDAGFEIRDMIAWVYGSGFPKSLNISKAIDKAAGAKREVIGEGHAGAAFHYGNPGEGGFGNTSDKDGDTPSSKWDVTASATDAARQWEGWGTALKPAMEPITVARKPFKGTVVANVQEHGTGGLNIDDSRVPYTTVNGGNLADNPHLRDHINGGNGGNIIAHEEERRVVIPNPEGRWPANVIHDGSVEVTELFPESKGRGHTPKSRGSGGISCDGHKGQDEVDEQCHGSGSTARYFYCAKPTEEEKAESLGRWPANVIHDGSEVVVDQFPTTKSGKDNRRKKDHQTDSMSGTLGMLDRDEISYGDEGSAARFFYCAKASKKERGPENKHPTVKPIALMEYLVKLVTPPCGVTLDPFMGSGTTGIACKNLGFSFLGIEREPDYYELAERRIGEI